GAASKDGSGFRYGMIWVDGQRVKAHRVALSLAGVEVPEGYFVDHRCGNTLCVNAEHLRPVTPAQNRQHMTRLSSRNTSGERGVDWVKDRSRWKVQVRHEGKAYGGGLHRDKEQAIKAARELRRKLYTHDDHHKWEAVKTRIGEE